VVLDDDAPKGKQLTVRDAETGLRPVPRTGLRDTGQQHVETGGMLVDEALIRLLILDDGGMQPVAHGRASLASLSLYVINLVLDGGDEIQGRRGSVRSMIDRSGGGAARVVLVHC